MFGVWKQRFRCLRTPIRTKMQNTLTIIVATACLHNYAMRRGEVVKINASDETNSNDIDAGAGGNNENPTADEPTNIAGTALRRQIYSKLLVKISRYCNAVVPNLRVNYPRGVICDSSVGNVTPLSKRYA